MSDPTPQDVINEVSKVVEEVDEIASTPQGRAALHAAVVYGTAEHHEE